MPASGLPSGLVTFLFTDIAGSTRLFQKLGDRWPALLLRHQDLLRQVFAAHGGVEVRTEGDSFFVAFDDPVRAVQATARAQAALTAERWPDDGVVRVRAGLHTGYAVPQDGDYVALAVHQAARVSAAAHPGQTLVTEACAEAVGIGLPPGLTLVHLGSHRLKDFDVPQPLFELRAPGVPQEFPPLDTAWRGETNLPLQRTSFVGRQHDYEAVRALFRETRLVTLVGPGGSGKTRLAVHVAAQMIDGSGDGVWLVELAPLTDPELVPTAVARALGIIEERDRQVAETLVGSLRQRRLLLVLDNCEHVVAACAELVDTILRSCPDVIVLATSRQPLNIEGERAYRLMPLEVPPDVPDLTAEDAANFEAVELFVERARVHQPSFSLDDTTVRGVTSVCRRLEGIPLALELAAARLRSLSIDTIDARLDDQFRLLTGGHRSAMPRQQTLRALVDWSYDLLDDAERELFAELSVFTGGWTLDASEAVAASSYDVLDVLTSLVDKSLVQAESRGGDVRYGLLEIVRQYAAERLAERGDSAVHGTRLRHRDFYLKMAEQAKRERNSSAQRQWLDRLDAEDGNLRAALATSLEDAAGTAAALRLVSALSWYWVMRGRAVEGRQHGEAVLARADRTELVTERAAALVAVGGLLMRSGDFTASRSMLEEGLAFRRAAGDDVGSAEALNDLAWLATRCEAYEDARSHGVEALALAEAAGETHLVGRIHATLGDLVERWDLLAGRAHFEEASRRFDEAGDRGASARVRNNLGLIDIQRGDLAGGRRALEECLTIFSDLQDAAALPTVLSNLGLIAVEEADYERADDLFARGLTLGYRARDKELMVYTLLGLGMAAGGLGADHRAAVLHGAADALSAEVGMGMDTLEAKLRERSQAELRARMGEQGFDAAYREGQGLDVDSAVDLALTARVLNPSP